MSDARTFLSSGVHVWLRLSVLLLTAPFFLFPRPAFVPVYLLIPVFWLLRWRKRGSPFPYTPLNIPVLGLGLMILVSLWATPDITQSIRKVLGLTYGITLMYAIVDLNLVAETGHIATLILALGSGSALLSFVGTRWTVKFGFLKGLVDAIPRLMPQMLPTVDGFNPNTVAGTLIMFVPLQGALCLSLWHDLARRRWQRWGAWIGVMGSLVITLLVVLLSQSRAAWGALGLGMIVFLWFAVRSLRPLVLVLVLTLGLSIIFLGPGFIQTWLDEASTFDLDTLSLAGRIEIWSRALYGTMDFPFTGMGMDMFREVVWILYPLFRISPGRDIGHAHNIFLQTALDLGIPGLICYLALLGVTMFLGYRVFRLRKRSYVHLVALGAVCGLLVHALWGLIDALPLGSRTQFLWWAVVGLVIVAYRDSMEAPLGRG